MEPTVKMEDEDTEENCGYSVVTRNETGAMFLTFPVNESFLDCKECNVKGEGHCSEHELQVYIRNADTEDNGICNGNKDKTGSKDDTMDTVACKKRPINKSHLSSPRKSVIKMKKKIQIKPGASHDDGSMRVHTTVGRKFTGDDVSEMESSAVTEPEPNTVTACTQNKAKNNSSKPQTGRNLRVKNENGKKSRPAKYTEVDTTTSDMENSGLPVVGYRVIKEENLQNDPEKESSICDVCGMELTVGSGRRRHKVVLTGEKPYVCDICGVRFDGCSGMRTHKRVHTGEKPFKCDVCAAAFARGTDLNIHKRIHTGEKPYKCDVCHVAFTCSGHLVTHRRLHTGEKPYICGVCDMGFTSSGSLRKHSWSHTGEKPFKCDVCGFGVATGERLKKHKRIHSGEKPYKCEHCPSEFTSSSSLVRHSRVHSGLKPFKCAVCSVAFGCKSVLRKHERMHTGEKPYKCDDCGMRFTASFNLGKHKKLHTANNPYRCQVCSAAFTCAGSLTKHKRIHVVQVKEESEVGIDLCV